MTDEPKEISPENTQEDHSEGVYDPKKILVVEDDIDISFIMKRRLTALRPHDTILEAKTIYSSVSMIQKEHPDVIFLDLNLPDGFGATSVSDIRKYDKKTPIIVTTGLANELTTEECLKAGAQQLIIKSHITKEFLETILDKYLGPAVIEKAPQEGDKEEEEEETQKAPEQSAPATDANTNEE